MMNSALGVLIYWVLVLFLHTRLFALHCCSTLLCVLKMNAKVQRVFWDLVAKGKIPPPPAPPNANGATVPKGMVQPAPPTPPNAHGAAVPKGILQPPPKLTKRNPLPLALPQQILSGFLLHKTGCYCFLRVLEWFQFQI